MVEVKYIIGFSAREDILYFPSEEAAKKHVMQKRSLRTYLGEMKQTTKTIHMKDQKELQSKYNELMADERQQ